MRVEAADGEKQVLHRLAHARLRRVDARDDLRDDEQPRVDVHEREPVAERGVDARVAAVAEPEGEQPQQVLQALLEVRAERDRAEEARLRR